MSEHLEMSGESSLDKNFQIRTNNEGENELYIPCWEEEGSNSTQYHHLIEETKFYKNKCNHLENHLEENHREFSSLNQLYMIAESNERRLLKENQDYRKNHQKLSGELTQARTSIDGIQGELHACSKRETELRERFIKLKEKEGELLAEIDSLRSESEMLRKRAGQGARQGGEQQKWRRHYNEQILKNEEQWKAAYEELQSQFDRKSKEVRERMQEIKTLNKNCNSHKQDYQLRIRSLEGELQESKRQLTKSKTLISDYQRQIKDLKLVRDEVSAKNDEIEGENGRIKKALKEDSTKYHQLESKNREIKDRYEQAQIQNNSLTLELNGLKATITQLKNKLGSNEKQLSQLKAQRERSLINRNHLENANSTLQQEFATFKRDKENEINLMRIYYENKLKELKEANNNERSALQNSLTTLRQDVELLRTQKRQNSRLQALSIERLNQLEDQIVTLKEQVLNWRDKYEKLSTKYREEQLSLPKECNHLSEISELRLEIRRMTEERQELKGKANRLSKLSEDLNTKLQESKHTVEQLIQERQRQSIDKRKLAEQNDRLKDDRSKLLLDIQNLQNQRNTLISEKREYLASERSKNQIEMIEFTQKNKALEMKLRQKSNEIDSLTRKIQSIEQELQVYRSKPREEPREPQRDRNKKYDLKLKEKEREIQDLEERLQEIESTQDEERAKYKAIEKENRSKENELNKKERKIKQLEKSTEDLLAQIEELESSLEEDRSEVQTLRRQLKTEQTANEKLKLQITRSNSEKENRASQQPAQNNKEYEKQRHQWEQTYNGLISQLEKKEGELHELRNRLQNMQNQSSNASNAPPINKTDSNFSNAAEIEQYLRLKIKELQEQVKGKDQTIKRLQNLQRKDDDISPSGSLEQLQAEYNRQLLALKRLIMYKGYKQDESKKLQEMKAEYESKIQLLLSDYKNMYQEMMLLKEKVITQRVTVVSQPVDISAIEQIWRIKIDQLSEQRQVLIEKVAMWQRKYEQLRYLFQAKIQSKQQTINLLNLKLSNLQMARPSCQYTCHR